MATRRTGAAESGARKMPIKTAGRGGVTGTAKQGRAAKKSAATMRAKQSAAKSRASTMVTGRKVSSPKAKSTRVGVSKAKAAPARAPKIKASQIKTPAVEASRQLAAVVSLKLPRLDALKDLEKVMTGAHEVTIREGKHTLRIAGDTLDAVRAVVAALGSGRPSLLVGDRSEAELTSQEVADLLNVSRPHVVKLARTGELPHRKVGNRHRFRLSDVEEYEDHRRAERESALAAMVPEGGYTAEDF